MGEGRETIQKVGGANSTDDDNSLSWTKDRTQTARVAERKNPHRWKRFHNWRSGRH